MPHYIIRTKDNIGGTNVHEFISFLGIEEIIHISKLCHIGLFRDIGIESVKITDFEIHDYYKHPNIQWNKE